ncbi:dihydroxy-acid dehydratase [Vigna unguiculata]|uniref:Dihydroxy-acid dehydratase n=1 Tax=Vigna unguiculata TaxID=3917 RepID=A0A4D6L843_VIGUN|nr:dihydroxy-acid dehydratase [Vigna unguiculata]QCE09929.1 dihydroxy-acid dehydratase [Vigna unguiculata]
MAKPQVGVSSVRYEGNTCNIHLLLLFEAIHEGVVAVGMVPFHFNIIGVDDAISMGTKRMCYSLQSRDLIVDSIKAVNDITCTLELICVLLWTTSTINLS